jgi:hypothetical protein
VKELSHRFVDRMPDELSDGVLYVSLDHGTVLHKCACGCGHEVNTPLGRTDWSLTYDGETVSLWPSVGNWSFPCRSHYVVERGAVRWAGSWTEEEVEAGRRADRALKAAGRRTAPPAPVRVEPSTMPKPLPSPGPWTRLLRRIGLR